MTTSLKKRTLKKLLLHLCTKTPFSINGELYRQLDGVEIVEQLINSNIIKFYKRYVDTLILAKSSDIPNILAKFNSYHSQIRFTLDDFPDNNDHFLDIKITCDGTTIFRKSTHTGQYSHISNARPWSRKTAWIRHKKYAVKNMHKEYA